MSEISNLNEIERRVKMAVYQDGLVELFCGVFLLFIGTLFQKNASISGLAVLSIFLLNPLLERVKQRWIYPRSGYVNPRQDPQELRGIPIAALIFVLILVATLWISIRVQGVEAGRTLFLDYLMPPMVGIVLAIGPWWMAQKHYIRRAYLWSVLFIGIGFATPIFRFSGGYAAVGLNCVLVGFAMLVTGLTLFIRFVRSNPVPEVDDVSQRG